MKFLLAFVLTAAVLTSGSVVKPPGENFELLILHNNDMHARFEQTSQLSGACTTADREAGKCYGGFPRVAHVVKEARRAAQTGEGPPVLYLNAGDTYTGTAWFTIYKWKIAAEFINALQPDAVSLGNNEVNQDENTLFLDNINTPVVATNVIIKSSENTANLQKSIIFTVNDIKVGVVGYLTPESGMLDSIGNIEYIDEILALTEEVEKLQALNVNIIIALGHSTLAKDKEIAKEVPGLDMIIAGNKNTFYWNGSTVPTTQETLLVAQESGKTVPIIFSTAYDKYLGRTKVTFDTDGEIIDYINNPILLDSSVPLDLPSLDVIKKYETEFASSSQEVLGDTSVVLDAESCLLEECNFGNLVADAINYFYAINYNGEAWTDAPITIIHSGAFRKSIAPANRPAAVTQGDLLLALPLESNLVTVTMKGAVLKQVLEHSVSDYNRETPSGRYLQFSGIRAEFDYDNPSGTKLLNAVVRCSSCAIPDYSIINDAEDYKVLMPIALSNGEHGYEMLVGLPRMSLWMDEVTCASEYIKMKSPVYPEVAARIVGRGSGTTIAINSSLLLFTFLSIFMNIYN